MWWEDLQNKGEFIKCDAEGESGLMGEQDDLVGSSCASKVKLIYKHTFWVLWVLIGGFCIDDLEECKSWSIRSDEDPLLFIKQIYKNNTLILRTGINVNDLCIEDHMRGALLSCWQASCAQGICWRCCFAYRGHYLEAKWDTLLFGCTVRLY